MIDGTFGAGGYTREILETGANVLAIDRDPTAIKNGQSIVETAGNRLVLREGRFSDLDAIALNTGLNSVDGVVLDIGVSSMQLDQAERGFSFQKDGPLDMRMSKSGVSAADIVNNAKQQDLTRIIGLLGEEKRASQISREIVKQRDVAPILTTKALSDTVLKVIPRKHNDKTHPATRTFQALRIFVNQELEELVSALCAAERILKPGGRLVVVSFHSLEDRIVKRYFADRIGKQATSRHLPFVNEKKAFFKQEGNGLLKAGDVEVSQNPRARSAKLRWAVRTTVDSEAVDTSLFGLPDLTKLQQFSRESELAGFGDLNSKGRQM